MFKIIDNNWIVDGDCEATLTVNSDNICTIRSNTSKLGEKEFKCRVDLYMNDGKVTHLYQKVEDNIIARERVAELVSHIIG